MVNEIDLAAIAAKHGVQEIELPGWDEQPFNVLAKRPTLYNMAATGFIPNPLLDTVRTMFFATAKEIDVLPADKQAKALIQMAKYALVRPTYDEIADAGLTLTDAQLLTLYAFATGGAAVLDAFRRAMRGGNERDGAAVQSETQPTGGD
ncbi:MAG: hypothetical protein RSC06_10560 [Clostridia bacterium]